MLSGWRRILSVARAEHAAFLEALRDPVAAQERQLLDILAADGDSAFGRRHALATVKDVDAFRSKVPLHGYDDLAGEIEAMAAGAPARLGARKVVLFEETSGTTSGAKLIPYTAASLHAFRRALYPWLFDLVQARPRIAEGRSYWALSPAARPARVTPGGVPIGMTSDAGYFGEEVADDFASLSVVPAALASLLDVDDWRYLTLRCLLAAADLSLISIWSPTFLSPLLEGLVSWGSRLVADVAEGTVSLALPPALEPWRRSLRADPARARTIADGLSCAPVSTAVIWPALDTISCWTDAGARPFVEEVRAALPHAFIQGKGLLATEAVVTIPLARFPYPVPAITSVFFEFLDGDGRSWLCHQVREGETYRVITTTHGGLFRYDLGDRVLVRGWAEGVPMLEFVGREGLVSDLCGEKLTEHFVLTHLPHATGFAMLAPSVAATPHYVLFLDAARVSAPVATSFASRLDEALGGNPHYRHARRLGQLGHIEACRVAAPMEAYSRFTRARGQRLGEIKPPALRPETDWEARFASHVR